ncbi:MAG: CIA30 family protein [Pleurocapsa sp.]
MSSNQASRWDLGRFWQTLTYFEIIPVISSWQRLLNPQRSPQNIQQQNKMKVLVVGATGGVGKRVVKSLLQQNYDVIALVRDAVRGKKILGEDVPLFEADLTLPETLTPEIMQGVSGVICCSGTKVQPVEGDTPTREKYYQGIKFYLPEVADSPELVEYRGMKNLLEVVSQYIQPANHRVLFDFTAPTADIRETWGAVDDVVMGGVSQSNIRLSSDRAIFSGIVSTDNNGGFASVRTRNFNPPLDLIGYDGIELRVKGDGKRYKFITRCEGKWDGIGYSYSFDTIYNFPITVRIPFKDLIPVFRAKAVRDADPLDASKIYSMQLMLSKFEYDGALNPKFEAGNFGLEVEYIKAYSSRPKPQFILISSAGVTRPGRPDLNLEDQPPAVRMNDQLGGILTWKLRGEEAVQNSGLNYTIIRPCALTEKPGNKRLYVEQGDNLKGQVSRDAIASLAIQALQSPEAVNKTFEVRETDLQGENNWQDLFASLD